LLIKVAKQKLKKQILPIPTATNILQSSEQKNKTKKVKKLWESAAKSLLKTATSKINKKDTCKAFLDFLLLFLRKSWNNFFTDFRNLNNWPTAFRCLAFPNLSNNCLD